MFLIRGFDAGPADFLRGFDAGQLTSMLFPRTLRLRGFDAGPADFHAFSMDTAS